MQYKTILISFLLLAFMAKASAQELLSPDKQIKISFSLSQTQSEKQPGVPEGTPYYEVSYGQKPFLLSSRLGFDLLGTAELKHYFRVAETLRSEKRATWKPVYGEKDEYPDNYNEMTMVLEETLYPNRRLHIVFRAYNEGIAFRYVIPAQKGFEKVLVNNELTEFNFPGYTSVWESHGHEGKYRKVFPSEIQPDCELPLTCVTSSGIYGAILEAGNSHYPRAYVEAPNRRANTLHISLRGEAKSENGLQTAWRAITLATSPGGLIEQNYLVLNLNEECKIAETSWIKPGTVMRETTMSTPEAYKLIDFCYRKGIDYMLFDAGWYGRERDVLSDPSAVKVINNSTGAAIPGHPGLDMAAVVKYAAEKGIGIFLYVNGVALERHADKIFPLYEQWGVKGIKPGFVRVGNQEWQEWIETLVAKAAEHHLMVNIHDAYRPTGFSRTYPNLLSQEGIHGNEQNPDADHDVMLPFTRYTIGAGDYTPGYCRDGLQSTWVHRLALPVIYYSPAQFILWREKPNDCHERPELKLWEDIPTVWDDTKVLSGEIGEYIVTARRTGNDWYVSGITNANARSLNLDFAFLTAGRKYEATIYTDDPASDETVNISVRKITSKDKLSFDLKNSGGVAMKIQYISK